MALSLTGANIVKQKTLAETRRPKIQAVLKAFWSYWAQHKKSADLQFVSFAALETTDVVIADAACKVYLIFIQKPSASSTAAFFKGTDHATTGSSTAAELVQKVAGSDHEMLAYFDGFAMANGFTILSETTADGSTGSSAADRPDGFIVVGAP
jgi:hypothetical protein